MPATPICASQCDAMPCEKKQDEKAIPITFNIDEIVFRLEPKRIDYLWNFLFFLFFHVVAAAMATEAIVAFPNDRSFFIS